MSDGGRDRASIGVEVWKSSQKETAERSAVRSIAWLDLRRRFALVVILIKTVTADRLTTAPRAGLKVTPNLVERATTNSTVVTCWVIEIVFALAVWHTIILL
jgi:hypothetical protein